MARWQQLTESEKDEAVSMYASGNSCVAIGYRFQRSGTGIRNILVSKGVKIRSTLEFRNGLRTNRPPSEEEKLLRRQARVGNWEKYRQRDPRQYMLYGTKQRAIKKGIPFNLDRDDVVIPDLCPVFGMRLRKNYGLHGPTEASPTIDRIRPELGYVKGNVRVISEKANRLKSNATVHEIELVLADMKRISADGSSCL